MRALRTPRAGAFLVVLAAGLLVSACGSGSSSSSASGGGSTVTSADLDGSTFTSTGADGHDLVAGSTVRLTFDHGSMAANAGCNTITSSYDVKDGTLAWTGAPAATMMGCPDELMNQDTWLTGFLTQGATATLDGDDLTLTADDVTLRLQRETAEPNADLTGHHWRVTDLITGSSTSSVPTGVDVPTLDIADDGSFRLFTGCNGGHTQVTLDGTTAHFAPVATTKMACPPPAAKVEQQLLKALEGVVTVTIDGSTATLNNGQYGLGMTTD